MIPKTKPLSFPVQDSIFLHLTHHPLTKEGYEQHKQVYQAIAHHFSHGVASRKDLDYQVVVQVIGNLDLTYRKHPEKTVDLICRIAGALSTCAMPLQSKL